MNKVTVIQVFHLPDSSFGYGSIQQRAEASIQTLNAVTLNRLLHTVNWRKTPKLT